LMQCKYWLKKEVHTKRKPLIWEAFYLFRFVIFFLNL
jgi:hypothetical protein